MFGFDENQLRNENKRIVQFKIHRLCIFLNLKSRSLQLYYSNNEEGARLAKINNLYGGFDMNEVDLNLENYEELFGMALSHSEELFENGGIDSLFGTKEMSAGDSNCQGAVAAEVLSSHYQSSVIALQFFVIGTWFVMFSYN